MNSLFSKHNPKEQFKATMTLRFQVKRAEKRLRVEHDHRWTAQQFPVSNSQCPMENVPAEPGWDTSSEPPHQPCSRAPFIHHSSSSSPGSLWKNWTGAKSWNSVEIEWRIYGKWICSWIFIPSMSLLCHICFRLKKNINNWHLFLF